MQPDSRKLLVDIRDAAKSIAEFSTGRALGDFVQDKLFRPALYFQFIIVGEALSRLRAIDEEMLEGITECRRIIGFRNQIVHGYSKIDDEITWRIIQDKLPVLRREIEGLLGE